MYTGFNAKKERKRTRIEELQLEVKRLQKLLGTMIHLHERLKDERSENSEVAKLPTLSAEASIDGKSVEGALDSVPVGTDIKPAPRNDEEGA